MRRIDRNTVAIISILLALVCSGTYADPTNRFLSLAPSDGLPVIPMMEGWIANEDGSYSFSFGFVNLNRVDIDIPLGANNYMEPAEYGAMLPTHFPAGRTIGAFTITVPAELANIDVWWYLKTGSNEVAKVPGRAGRSAYELDFVRPRPEGSMQPLAGFGEDDDLRAGLLASIEDYPRPVSVGEPVNLTVKVRDPSVRNKADHRYEASLPVGVHFSLHQGPGAVEFTRDKSTVVPENPYPESNIRHRYWQVPKPNFAQVKTGEGMVRVNATFSTPGDYIIRAEVENFGGSDSASLDQCCWTNVFQRIKVTP